MSLFFTVGDITPVNQLGSLSLERSGGDALCTLIGKPMQLACDWVLKSCYQFHGFTSCSKSALGMLCSLFLILLWFYWGKKFKCLYCILNLDIFVVLHHLPWFEILLILLMTRAGKYVLQRCLSQNNTRKMRN